MKDQNAYLVLSIRQINRLLRAAKKQSRELYGGKVKQVSTVVIYTKVGEDIPGEDWQIRSSGMRVNGECI